MEHKNFKFSWDINPTYYALMDIAGISIKEFNTNPKAGIEIYKEKNIKTLLDTYEGVSNIPNIAAPSISYGHLSTLGFELIFPENGEVNYIHKDISIDECIISADKTIDYYNEGYAPKYFEYYNELCDAYPSKKVGFNYSCEGPLTTVYEMRNEKVFFDPYDNPEKFKELLKSLTQSIIRFRRFQAKIKGHNQLKPNYGIYDDIAAMFSPEMWSEFVIPFWKIYFEELTTNHRFVHCEDMSKDHLKHLEKMDVTYYEPAISGKLTPEIISNSIDIPFSWKLEDFHYPSMDALDIQDWVFKAVGDGAERIWTVIRANMNDDQTIKKIITLAKTCKTIETMIKKGASRKNILECVSHK